ncbi:chemotaxis protein histidine kinase CheA [Variovorax boronicumulans]|uniref:Chemotaxis protein histidine kinase CheA n=1 Tax=Variovorax boronicumulans TaxID=436515 RepID=A0AAW8E2V0_9BURK|nr:hypothetical protein [Variovorax boronicumulans]MDP9881020.1 chemotaxis protein histidine kinase CheA [Variovorax boronicumulans]MDP9926205.1 chemotaxis protein histidine kinase CheA [Variovorax boronicumulans]
MSTGMDDDDLHDARLRRALDHAPDRDAVPAAHTREAILKMAHNLAAASAPAAGPAVEAAPWWRRLFGGGSPRSRMPWNAAFATVLVATFVTVLWHREPVPDARLDGEAQVAGAPAPAQSAEAPAVAAAPAPAAEPASTADMTPPAAQRTEAARDAKESLKQRDAQETRDASRRREAPAAAASVQKDEARAMEKAAPAAPVVQAPAPMPAPAAPAIASAPMPAAPPMADVGQSPMPYAAAPPAPAAAPAAPAPAPMQRESADTAPLLAAQGGASANVAGMQRRAAPAPSAAAKAVATGGFTALDRWTALDITRAGTTTRQMRGDTEGLAALVNTVARAATVSGGEWGAPVEARIELRRDGALLAVLEIAGDQVRWTPQPGGPAFLGTPPAQALDALRTALSRAR